MNQASAIRRKYLGVRPGDLDGKPYARHWNPRMAPLPKHAQQTLAHGPVAAPLLPPMAEAARELEARQSEIEDGYCVTPQGTLHVAIRTDMPGVSPAMVDWWFGWHGDEAQKYKLWHPRAHVHAQWRTPLSPGATGRDLYIGRTSCVDEYIGSTLGTYFIRFLPPEEIGLDRRLADAQQATAICARVGFAAGPLDFGYLAHYVSRTDQGAEMRSRFWVGGNYVRARRGGVLGAAVVGAVKRILRPKESDGRALLVHCSQEMSHLATFLPALYAELGQSG